MPNEIFTRLANRNGGRTEADIQADVRAILLLPQLQIEDDNLRFVSLEAQVGDGRRIDVEIGSAVIEIKKDLRRPRVKIGAIEQLAGYVAHRTADTGTRYIGILTDGAEWHCYDLVGQQLHPVTSFDACAVGMDVYRLLVWLEGVLATAQNIPATSAEIAARLGASSSAHALDHATIKALYERNRDLPTVRMKRGLWSKLLTSTLGTQFEDTDDLFIEHTLLVNSSEIIAHCVLGIEVAALDPNDLLSGALFVRSSIYGVVEQDFFDWPLEVESGAEYVRALARRLGRFDWSNVSQDVLKTLYESVITPETRKRLGEYYTPDWLAEMVVAEVVSSPLDTRALDPACGSGTFLFHAVRRYLAAARAAGIGVAEALTGVSSHVYGMDLHPVAVTLARVTYLLAIGAEYLQHPDRGPIYIPVYLGDSMQWSEQSGNLWNAGDLVIAVEDAAELFTTELRFPDALLQDAAAFDRLVEDMAQSASRREQGSRRPSIASILQRNGVPQASRATVEATFATMCDLHDQGRNHIWSYYVRNLARPMWLAREGNRVHALIGNPPWLAYRHMPEDLQQTFHAMEVERGLWAGAENATHQDLSALFVVRAVELYLRNEGRFGLVMPNAVVDRDHYAGFRLGSYVSRNSRTLIAFDPSWDFRRVRPHFFPRGSSVIFGSRNGEASREMPLDATIYSGNIGRTTASLDSIRDRLIRTPGHVTIRNGTQSSYASRFRQGATFVPRFLFFVDLEAVGPLGAAAGQIAVQSSRSANEKIPWKNMQSQSGMIEGRFVRPLYSGETLLPYLNMPSLLCVTPERNGHLMTQDEIAQFPGLSDWWRKSNEAWKAGQANDRLSLMERVDYMHLLSVQFPAPPLRVIYNSAGMHVAAAKLYDTQGVINNKLYWCTAQTEAEADYLCAILNSPVTTEMVRPLMSYGKDERDIHKHVWKLPVPEFDPAIPSLARLSTLGRECAALAQSVQLRENIHFAALRRDVRTVLDASPLADEIDALVYELLS